MRRSILLAASSPLQPYRCAKTRPRYCAWPVEETTPAPAIGPNCGGARSRSLPPAAAHCKCAISHDVTHRLHAQVRAKAMRPAIGLPNSVECSKAEGPLSLCPSPRDAGRGILACRQKVTGARGVPAPGGFRLPHMARSNRQRCTSTDHSYSHASSTSDDFQWILRRA